MKHPFRTYQRGPGRYIVRPQSSTSQDVRVDSEHSSASGFDLSVEIAEDQIASVSAELEALRADMAEVQHRVDNLPRMISIQTIGLPGLRLRVQLPVRIVDEQVQVVVDSPDLEVYGVGETEGEALDDLRQAIGSAYQSLKEFEGRLGVVPEKQFRRFKELLEEISE